MDAVQHPWKKEDDQWQELSRSVEALKNKKAQEEEQESKRPPSV